MASLAAGSISAGVLTSDAPYRVAVTCSRRRSSGKNTSESILWQEEQTIDASRPGRGVAGTWVPFQVVVPFELPSSMVEPASGEQVIWSLKLEASLAGADLASRFEVPVFETAESCPELTERLTEASVGPDSAHPDPAGDAATPYTLEVDRDIEVTRRPDGALAIDFPPGRNKLGAAFVTLFAACWMALVGFAAMEMPGAMRLFMAPFVAVGLLMGLFVPAAWLQKTMLTARRGELEIRTRSFGAGRPRVLRAGDIESISIEAKGAAGGRPAWSIQVTSGGRSRAAA